jgi:hypothetical protein
MLNHRCRPYQLIMRRLRCDAASYQDHGDAQTRQSQITAAWAGQPLRRFETAMAKRSDRGTRDKTPLALYNHTTESTRDAIDRGYASRAAPAQEDR